MAKTPVQFRLNGSDKAVFVDGGENLLERLAPRRRRHVGPSTAAARARAGCAPC